MRRRRLLSVLLAATLPGAVARAQRDAGGFVRNLAQRAIDEVNTPGISEEERLTRFRTLFREGFDVPLIARFVLGRYWRIATEAQREDYLRLFDDLIVQTYARRFGEFPGARISVLTVSRPNEDGDQIVAVEGQLPGKAPVRMDVRVRPADGVLKIIDIAIEGVSMAITQRDEFAAVIQRGGGEVDALLANLRQKVGAVR
jgi:phospholipid transport system substrate-binding protein